MLGQGGGHPGMMNGMYGMGPPQQNGLVGGGAHAMRTLDEAQPPPAKRFKPAQQAQAVMQDNHGTSLVEAMNALEIQSHLDTLLVSRVPNSA